MLCAATFAVGLAQARQIPPVAATVDHAEKSDANSPKPETTGIPDIDATALRAMSDDDRMAHLVALAEAHARTSQTPKAD